MHRRRDMEEQLLAGTARREITPPVGSPLSGFIARLGVSTSVAHPLFTRALVLADGRTTCVIVEMDLLGLAGWHVEELRRRCSSQWGIPANHVMISCTHTHSGPGMMALRGCMVASLGYQWKVIDSTWESIREAHRTLSPARLFAAKTPFRLGINRRQQTKAGIILGAASRKPAPETVNVLEVRMRNGRSCVLFSHACHPYILGGDQTLISGDFPGVACNCLEERDSHSAMFLNGCAGDIAPIRAFEGPDAVCQEGQRLAAAVREQSLGRRTLKSIPLLARSMHVYLPHRELPTKRELQAMANEQDRTVRAQERAEPAVKKKIRCALQDWSEAMLRIITGTSALEPVFAEVQTIRAGEVCLVGISGEPFFSIGQCIARLSNIRNTWVLGYCNAYSGYHPTAKAYTEGGYEVSDSYRYLGTWQLDSSGETRIVKAAQRLLKEVHAR